MEKYTGDYKGFLFKKEVKKQELKKNGYNSFKKYNYYLIEDIEQIIHNAEIKLEVSFDIVGQKIVKDRIYQMVYLFEGREFLFEFEADTEQKNKIQSSGSTSTYAHRYALQRIFGLSESVIDPDSDFATNTKKQTFKKPTGSPKVIKEIKEVEIDVVKTNDTKEDVDYIDEDFLGNIKGIINE